MWAAYSTEWHQGLRALTTLERWQAIQRSDTGLMTGPWFILGCVTALLVMMALLVWVSVRRIREEQMNRYSQFNQAVTRYGLSTREARILHAVARRAGLKHMTAVFESNAAFERGAAALLEDKRVITSDVHRRRMTAEIGGLRDKLKRRNAEHSLVEAKHAGALSSRRIPPGQTVTVRPGEGSDVNETKAEVIHNGHEALTLQLYEPLTVTFGPVWRVCYYIGSTVWAFDTEVTSYDGRCLTVKHSHHGRFMNRRRFLRVPVRYPALIAPFGFEYLPPKAVTSSRSRTGTTTTRTTTDGLDPAYVPTFVPAWVTELAGPGLSIESSLDGKAGDRLLVLFEPNESTSGAMPGKRGHAPRRLIADVAEVRHTRPGENGLCMAVEMSEARGWEVSELIRLTNAAHIRRQEQNVTEDVKTRTRTTVKETVAV